MSIKGSDQGVRVVEKCFAPSDFNDSDPLITLSFTKGVRAAERLHCINSTGSDPFDQSIRRPSR